MAKRIDASTSDGLALAGAEGFGPSRWGSRFVLVALLVAATFLAFAPALDNKFVKWYPNGVNSQIYQSIAKETQLNG